MTRPLRVMMVGRHFWPHGSIDSAAFLTQLAFGLRRRGLHIEVVTPRYASSWPEELWIRDVKIHRPAAAPRSDWSMGRYVRHLTNWLRDRAASTDVMFADAMREESSAVIDATRGTSCGTVLRSGGWGQESDALWWPQSRAGKRCSQLAKEADRLISKGVTNHRQLIAAGYSDERIVRIAPAFGSGPARTNSVRIAARKALASINRDLLTEADQPVLVCSAPMTSDSGIEQLSRSARILLDRYPRLRLWLIGDGPRRAALHDYLRGEGVRASIAMPGSFVDLEDVWVAADAYLQLGEGGLDHHLPAVVSAELPIICVDRGATREVLGSPLPGRPTDPGDTESLIQWFDGASGQSSDVSSRKSMRSAIRATMDDLDGSRRRAIELRKRLILDRPLSDSVDRYSRVFEAAAFRSVDPESSVGAAL